MNSAMPDSGVFKPASAFLGISAKSRDIKSNPAAGLAGRKSRYDLMRASGALLIQHDQAGALLPAPDQYRVCLCHRGIRGGQGIKEAFAPVYRRTDGGGARLSNVTRCGSVWLCPVCCMPVTEARRVELQAGMVAWTKRRGHVYLMTLTHPHEKPDSLADQVKRQGKAMEKFRTGRAVRAMREKFGVLGVVRGLEVTYGQNGWHPHIHMLVFGEPGLLDDGRTIDKLTAAWVDALSLAGLLPPEKISWAMEHALDLRGGEKAAEYIAKFGHDEAWGMSSEMTRHQAKAGMRGLAGFDGHVTPFQILDWASKGDALACRLWREFAEAFHGKRQLVWSAKMKKELGIADLTDEELANDDNKRPEEELAGYVSRPQLAILHSRYALGEFTDLVARYGGDQSDIDAWIDHIATRKREAQGTLIDRGKYSFWRQSGPDAGPHAGREMFHARQG